MANYCGNTRTNYFRVNDEAEFRNIIDRIMTIDDDNISIFEQEEDGEKYFGFGVYSAIAGFYPEDSDDEEDVEAEDVYKEIQQVLKDGDVCVIEEVGNEKLRYLYAASVIITKKDIQYINLHNETKKKIENILGVDNFELNDEY